jgi:hydrophobic/amphiphilic exporter-1 (mainly G- bacteria), HAE1 family
VVLTVGDLATVRDEFIDVDSFTRIDGKPGVVISVSRSSKEDLLAMSDAVRDYVEQKNPEMPSGYHLTTWGDRSVEVRDRMNLLSKNGLQGLFLVLLVLALFLDTRLAFWVAIGIPLAILGACAILLYFGHTLNMLTMFAFLMALGIVVDDAIVISENIHTHRQRGKSYINAAIDGTVEVIPSVIASVTTTIIAFMPLFFVTGVMGKFIAVMPLAMIAMLLISLLESMTMLPCHLAHGKEEGSSSRTLTERALAFRHRLPWLFRWNLGWLVVVFAFLLSQLLYPFRRLEDLFNWLSGRVNRGLEVVASRVYVPTVTLALKNPAAAISIAFCLLLTAVALIQNGSVPFVVFPKLDSPTIEASITFPDGTPVSVTDQATRQLEDAVRKLDEKHSARGVPLLKLTRRSVGYSSSMQATGMKSESSGSHTGTVSVELVDPAERDITSQEILAEWRALFGTFPGAEAVKFQSTMHGPGGIPIEFRLLAKGEQFARLEEAVEEVKAKLGQYAGVFDISDDSQPGKWEFQLTIKDSAKSMNVKLADLAETVRAAYYGDEVMRLQRGRHEVKLMVRYPPEERGSLANFDEIRVRGIDGAERPMTELADVDVSRAWPRLTASTSCGASPSRPTSTRRGQRPRRW